MHGDLVHSISLKWEIITNIEPFSAGFLLMKNNQKYVGTVNTIVHCKMHTNVRAKEKR